MVNWRTLADSPEMEPIADAIREGIKQLEKYYNKTDNSVANIVGICTLLFTLSISAIPISDH